jgi:hypothetical protein
MAREASDVLAFAERIAALCSQVLGETLVSIIVHGFLALDDYTPPYSDIDLLGIVNGPPPSRPLHGKPPFRSASENSWPLCGRLRVATSARRT